MKRVSQGPYTVHLSTTEIALTLAGLQTIRWGGDARIEPLFIRLYEQLAARAPGLLADMIAQGNIVEVEDRPTRRARAKLEALIGGPS